MSKYRFSRRKFISRGAALAGAAFIQPSGFVDPMAGVSFVDPMAAVSGNPVGELLYNGIRLPSGWPPKDQNPGDYDPMALPYIKNPPAIIPIDVGRQLFVDDFLIETTNLLRRFHQPVKYAGNPILKPETAVEMNEGYCPVAAPFSDGVFYDPADKLFKLWYMAGWFDGTALATSTDGIHWTRPALDVVPGSNLVLPRNDLRRDGASVWLDHDATDEQDRYKMYWFARKGRLGGVLQEEGGHLLTSPDGIHWAWKGKIGPTGDNTTVFYNPFRKVWVFTVRRQGRPVPPWSEDWRRGQKLPPGRARSYWENKSFFAARGNWERYDPVFWLGADKFDHKRRDYPIGTEPQLYKVDAVGYESILLGLFQLHYGPSNADCAAGGFPKLTELQIGFSRDGFHFDRTNRETFIGGTLKKESWERGYIHSVGGVCSVVGDRLYFYYTAFQGDETRRNRLEYWSGMYANAAMGVAVLRRDGFASLEASREEGMLFTRILSFTGKYLFVNLDGTSGRLLVELCDREGNPVEGYRRVDCLPISGDSTKLPVRWKDKEDLGSLGGRPIRIKFYLSSGKLYSFWVSKDKRGTSGGAIAAGGPGLSGYWDV